MIRRAAGLLLLAGFWCGTPRAQDQAEELTEQIMVLVNAERRIAGVPELQMYAPLHELAQDWAHNIARTDWLQHRPDLSTIQQQAGYSYLNENIYSTSGKIDPQRVVQGWMNSPGHRKNMLAAQAKLAGLGIAGRNSQGNLYVVFNAGTPANGQPGRGLGGITVVPTPRSRPWATR